ncbi:hypothetical protein GYMLUDRAFT_230114 [Collybiopsis luxurians FD-317 M1]|uniref:Unplaced genomic scaffold GYMLUscaffold_49, whole genome shotgun sequence n=1 Tax=Collybiopsis luxurians FD-317 M1 TaxID=944289 RepID=A0A0D0CMN7_9AGAR|nr:hypothetical protein GYMLUDRAFT_230114 [Collybiopsis luxurians FD-317 M1]
MIFLSTVLALTALTLQPGSASPLHPRQNSSNSDGASGVYNGGFDNAQTVKLRIGNGGAGQSGLVGAFADAYIQHSVQQGSDPFLVEWFLGDTTQSLANLASGTIDVALTYNEAAENASLKSGAGIQRELVFIDHFWLVGPPSNPANLSTDGDTVLDMFNKLVTMGNTDQAIPPSNRVPTRFLSRYDKSATNIKESQLFITIGQVPWAFAYSEWYHQYPRFPLQALQAASLLEEYTLTDKGTWLSSPTNVTDNLVIYKQGLEPSESNNTNDDTTILVNPCAAVLGSHTLDQAVASDFMQWLVADDGGQQVVREFKKNGVVLYAPASAANSA